MSYNPFGWDYPAGAEHDPNAPWNQKDPECEKCNGEKEIPCLECKGKGCEECNEEGIINCPECQ